MVYGEQEIANGSRRELGNGRRRGEYNSRGQLSVQESERHNNRTKGNRDEEGNVFSNTLSSLRIERPPRS